MTETENRVPDLLDTLEALARVAITAGFDSFSVGSEQILADVLAYKAKHRPKPTEQELMQGISDSYERWKTSSATGEARARQAQAVDKTMCATCKGHGCNWLGDVCQWCGGSGNKN